VRHRLARAGYTDVIVQNTLERLRSLDYINDETFARNWARTGAQSRAYGPKRIEQELLAKGISQSLVREVVRGTFGETNETENAKKLLAKRYGDKNLSDPKILRRAAAFLQGHGYGSKVISDLLGHQLEED
jgi:SOS response regulatory protein OraA/RecX